MEKMIIRGGRKLTGEVQISGAKNAALPLIAATLLAPGVFQLHNVPDLRDIRTIMALLEVLGITWKRSGKTLSVDSTGLVGFEAPYDLVKTMRASILVLGPLLARLGRARVSLPGGCAIGARPIDYHLQALQKMGANLTLTEGYIEGEVPGRLVGASIYFDIPSVTGTENILMAAVTAQGTTTIKNAAREPEVGNLVDMLTRMGARIEGRGTEKLIVHGVDKLKAVAIETIPDRIETGTYLAAVAAAGGNAVITNCNPAHLPAFLEKLRSVGVEVEEGASSIRVSRSGPLKSIDIKTLPFPGFPTDLQAQFMALMTMGTGVCVITETIFENRFMHVAELKRLGADIDISRNSAIVRGVSQLTGARVMATDLRASASLVIAGLAAVGQTEVSRIYHLERGYENMAEKLTGLGADIQKVRE